MSVLAVTLASSRLEPDLQRQARQGFPEVVFSRGKTGDQVVNAMKGLVAANGHCLATGIDQAMSELLVNRVENCIWDDVSQTCRVAGMAKRQGDVVVIFAGTSDLKVAEEAAVTLEYLGFKSTRFADVGVARIHRLLERLDEIKRSDVVIAVAGMEGALPSVIDGLVGQPVIAAPTSLGYGTGLGDVAALMAMLNSYAAGVAVMNIDNGFGAAVMAARILRMKRV
ncbi:MAG: nickel pincer cofactor biosynthesis protein LarB [Nitrosomonas sp.]|jgi:NCAIR mutase (PurE)-related protein|nr:nickel pincer cofactor biosynthesis protein LarB [Nitrosomonas sp.]